MKFLNVFCKMTKQMQMTTCRFFNAFYQTTKFKLFQTSRLKEFADDSSKFDEIDRKFCKGVENNVRKGDIAR